MPLSKKRQISPQKSPERREDKEHSGSSNPHIGSSFDDFLEEENICSDVTAVALKQVIAWQATLKSQPDDPELSQRLQYQADTDWEQVRAYLCNLGIDADLVLRAAVAVHTAWSVTTLDPTTLEVVASAVAGELDEA